MAKSFLAGEAAVKLIPHSAGFHQDARKQLKADKTLFHPVQLKANATGFRKDAQDRLKGSNLKVDVSPRLNSTGFRKKAQAQLDAGRPLNLKVDISARSNPASVATARKTMQAQLDAMKPLTIKVDADMSEAIGRVAWWRNMQQANAVTIRVEADTAGASAAMKTLRMQEGRGSGGRGGSGGGGAPLYRKMRTATMVTGATFAPIAANAAVGGLSALTGAASQAIGVLGLLPAAATAAGAGIAALAVGAYGVVGAFQALSKEAQDTSAADQGKKIAAATRNVTSAERGLTKAQEGVRRAQDDLNKSRMMAVRRLRDMNDELRLAPLNEAEAALAIREATKRLAEAVSGGDAIEIEGARIDVEKSKIEYDILKKQNQDLYNDTMAANKAGIEGDEQVVAAKQGIVDANDAVLDAQDQLTSAIEAQTEALTKQSAAAEEAAKAMAKLSPNAQAFVYAMRALGPEWTELRKAVQDRLFAGLGEDMTTLAKSQLPTLRAGLEGINILLNRGMRDSMAVFSSPAAVNDFNATLGNTQLMFAGLADTARPLSQAWIDIVTVGSSFLPRFGTQMADVSARFGEWIAKMRETGQMQAFFEASIEMAKQLGRIISNVAHILGDFFSAGAETGGGFLNTIETITGELRAFTESVGGQTAMKDFFTGVAEAVRTLAPILSIVAKTVFDTLGPALTDLVIGAGPGIVTMFEGLRTGLQAIAPVMPVVGQALGTIGEALGSVFEVLGPVIGETLAALAPAIAPLAELLGSIIIGLAPILPLVAQFVGLLVSALAPALTKIVEALTPVVQSLVDAFMPILPPLMDMLGQVAGLIADALVTAIQAIAPFLPQLIGMWAQLVTSMMPLIPVIVELALSVVPPLVRALEGIMPTVMRVVGILVSLVGYIVPILIPILRLLGQIVGEVFSWIGSLIGATFRNVIDPTLSFIGKALEKVGGFFNWLWNEVVKPVWGWLSKTISDGWTNYIEPAFGYLTDGIEFVGSVFDRIVKGIGEVWGTLRGLAAKPILFVVDQVINGALKPAWNAVAGIIPGLDEWDGIDVGPIKAAIGGYATGGYVSGPGGPREDKIPARLSNGEFVMQASAVDRIGVGTLNQLNNGTGDGDLRFADGGIVQAGAYMTSDIQKSMWDAVRTAFPNAQLSSGTRTEDVGSGFDNHMGGTAIDLGGPVGDLPEQARWINDTYGDTIKELIHWPLQGFVNRKNGAALDYGEPTNSQHMDHVHWAMSQMVGSDGKMVSEGGNGGGILGWIKDKASKLLSKMVDLFEKPMRKFGETIPDFGGSKIGQVPKTAFNGMLDGALTWIKGKIGAGSSNGGDPNIAYDVGAGAEQWRPLVEKLFTEKQIPMNLVDKYLYQIHRESTGDPNAINDWDSNAQAGTPSKGLAQVIDTTFASYADPGYDTNIYDPESNLRASLNYLLKDPKFGGQGVAALTGAGYDTGGLLVPGNTLVTNQTGENEYILTPPQMAMVSALIDVLKGVGMTSAMVSPIQAVDVQKINGKDLTGKDMPVTANTDGRDVVTGEAYGQPLQGAAIDKNTGEYLPANNGAPSGDESLVAPFSFKTDTPEWKAAKSIGGTFGFGKQFAKAESKAEPVNGLITAATQAGPAYAAALAGDPTMLGARIAEGTAAWATKSTTDFANFLPENAGGIMESALSGLAGPLIGTVNTGMSQSQLVETMEDVENRKARRTKTGRSRRG